MWVGSWAARLSSGKALEYDFSGWGSKPNAQEIQNTALIGHRCLVTLEVVLLHYTVVYHIIPYHYDTIQRYTILYHAISYRTIPCNTIPHH